MSILESLPCPQSPWLAWIGVPLELLQAIFLHPYFQINYPKSTRLYRLMVIPICIYMAFASIPRRTIWPIDKFVHFNFGFVTMPTFHFICLSIIYGLHQGPVFKSEVELFNQKAQKDTQGHDEKQEGKELDQHVEKRSKSPAKYSSTQARNRKFKSNLQAKFTTNAGEEKQKTLPPADESSIIQNDSTKSTVERPPSFGELVRWISALIMNPRGLICTWSPPEHVVPIQKNLEFRKFMINLIVRTVIMHFWFQLVCALGVEVVINSKADTNHFLFERLGFPSWRIMKLYTPFFLTVVLGGGAYSGFALAGGLFNIVEISTILFLQWLLPEGNSLRPEPINPSNYPPLFNNPWFKTSLTDFWGKGWQAVFRLHFLFCGAQPMYAIFKRYGKNIGKMAAVMGAMGLSAAMHEFCLTAVSKIDPTFASCRMFLSQGIGIVLEALFKQFTGRKVSGILGWSWTFGFMILNGKPMVDSWIERELGKGVVPFKEWGLIHHLVPFGPLITDEVYAYLMSWVKIF
ncbi:hypothetical protein PCANC_06730 [Puccinia coronata f. sp. avenae]|uniref:Wax synthase domain-containing protein n=1 Tax=Puccinia coronata f. sp. avenae TaxID=200324 RepID=A0A2N5VDP8_9BASI|nr:hypothetical protein PCASD_14580 [Puccinia coronata f. sp. avenae]PLW48124.1 hypothetical protein PCANC_06730 [Puccinia coronata f. sp. avenae]